MHQHKYFNLRLHETNELEQILHTKIIRRKILHEWPLSCVEQLTTGAGKKWIYKSQFGPTVESEFYAHAQSRLLISAKTLFTSEIGYTMMLFDFIEGQRIDELELSDHEVFILGQHLIENIAQIEGNLPHYLDISTEARWEALMEKMLNTLGEFVSQGIFKVVDHALLRKLGKWMACQEVSSALFQNMGFVHNDLSGDNVFVLSDGYRIIDWQRPILGPKELDLASLLDSLNREPLRHVSEGIVWIMYLLRIEWFTACAVRWFIPGQDTYDQAIARLGALVGKSA